MDVNNLGPYLSLSEEAMNGWSTAVFTSFSGPHLR